jgi:hypothetical protein
MEQCAPSISDRTVQAIADRADVDPRSVVRRLAGLPVRGRTGARIDRVIRELGVYGPPSLGQGRMDAGVSYGEGPRSR